MSVPDNPMGAGAAAMPPRSGVVAARPRPIGPAATAGITPSDIWRIIRRRVWVIVITSLILIVLGVCINIAWWLWWPSWPGNTVLQVESPVIQEALAERRLPPAWP